MTIKEVVEKHLKDNGFDGLVCPELECGCGLDDLFPCDIWSNECVPAYCVKCDCPDHDGSHYQTKKEEFHHYVEYQE